VGPSYQLSYSSLPYTASGKLNGLTLKKQFEKAFEEHAKGTLDYLQVGTFNEHIAQPQPNNFAPWVKSMGLENDTWASRLWVDMLGDGITRDLEPTVQDGGKYWKLFQSCMRVFHSGASTCNNATEPCCMRGKEDPASTWNSVYSLNLNSTGDNLLTIDVDEVRVLLKSQGWTQVCQPLPGKDASQFCAWSGNQQAPSASAYTSGPFLLNTFPASPSTLPCYRCLSHVANRHFASADSSCAGLGTVESTLGHLSQGRSSEYPRSLRTCVSPQGVFTHSLDSPCPAGTRIVEHLGFAK